MIADRRVEPLERFFLDDRGEALADAAGARVLVDDQHAVAVPRDGQHRRAIERHERAQVEDGGLDAVGARAVRRRAGATCTYAPYEMIARSSPARRSAALPMRQRRRRVVRQRLLDPRIAIERDVLVVEHRIGIGDGARHQRARVLRRRRHDDLQARRAIEPGLGVLAVVRARVTQAAPRHAHDHRHRPPQR